GEGDHFDLVQQPAHCLQHGMPIGAEGLLEVRPQQLMMPAQETRLGAGTLLGIALGGAVDTSAIEPAAEALGRLILADDTDQPCRCTEYGDVQCHVPRAPGPGLDLVDADNRYRRLRGDAFTGTMPVAIQHDISDIQYRGA